MYHISETRSIIALLILSAAVSCSKAGSTVRSSRYEQNSGEISLTKQNFYSDEPDLNAVKITGGSLNMDRCSIDKKQGDTDSLENCLLNGVNSAVLVTENGKFEMNGGSIGTNAVGASGISILPNISTTLSGVDISCARSFSYPLHCNGGTLKTRDMALHSDSSSVIFISNEGGEVALNHGSIESKSPDSPAIAIASEKTSSVIIDSVNFSCASGILLSIVNPVPGTSPTGILTLTGDTTMKYTGNVVADSTSSVRISLSGGAGWEGAFNPDQKAKVANVLINGSKWTLTSDSYGDTLKLENGAEVEKGAFNLSFKTTINQKLF